MRLAGIRLNENEGKFEFCDGEVDVAPINGTSPVQESKFCSENNIDTSIKKKKQKKRRRKNSISERNVQWGTVEEVVLFLYDELTVLFVLIILLSLSRLSLLELWGSIVFPLGGHFLLDWAMKKTDQLFTSMNMSLLAKRS